MHPLMMDLLPLVRQGYCCSQLLVQLLVQAQGREIPDLVRALHGLCHGIGQSGGPCGLLTGGACVLALLAGIGAIALEFAPTHPMQFLEGDMIISHTCGNTVRWHLDDVAQE